MQKILEGVVGMGAQLKSAHQMVLSRLEGVDPDAPLPNDDRELN
jgi:hypothetical protein